MEEIEMTHDFVTDELENSIVIEETEGEGETELEAGQVSKCK
jgi:hypothetical protein